MEPDTRIQHFGEDREQLGGGAAPPIFRTSLFTFPDVASFEAACRGEGERSIYTRVSNPTTRILEKKIADLEETEGAVAFASGMAAISAVLLGLLRQGDHAVMLSSAYSPTLSFARGLLRRFGVEVAFIAAGEFGRLESFLRDRTRLIYLESPASLTMDVLDLAAIAKIAGARGIPTALDNSWASPVFQKPARFGIDLSLHSGTKYISGHSDILLGLACASGEILKKIQNTAILLGGTLSPEDAFLAIRGLRTLPLRMARHQDSGLAVARFLESHPLVEKVLHPGLPSFPGHETARRQLLGWSGLFSFLLKGDPRRFADALEVFHLGVSWGGFESLVLPAVSTAPRDPKTNLRPDLPENLIRLSIGLEDPRDLIEDLKRGFEAVK